MVSAAVGGALRAIPYWLVLMNFIFVVIFVFTWFQEKATEWWYEFALKIYTPIDPMMGSSEGLIVMCVVAPPLIIACISSLIILKHKMPSYRGLGLSKALANLPWTKGEGKNQFGRGEVNMNLIGALVGILPSAGLIIMFSVMFTARSETPMDSTQKLASTSIYFGFGSTIALTFFLIPVARHSILLTALGWPATSAMRIHIWAGYAFFWFGLLHGVMYVPVWFLTTEEEGPVWRQVFPPYECWKWSGITLVEYYSHAPDGYDCAHKMFNISGVCLGFLMIAFILSSHNYVRRNYYRLFYILHVIMGFFLIVGIVWHWAPTGLFMAPSIVLYLGSTSPTLMQMFANYQRGGNHITKVTKLVDGGDCFEVALENPPETSQMLHTEANLYVKACVPSISLVWHPFTIFPHPGDLTTSRLLIRPVGPFTKDLHAQIDSRPLILVDGLYRGGDSALQAIHDHDHITIICGGVTITPYLSVIPVALSEMIKDLDEGRSLKCKTIVLHWACRERGLLKHVEALLKTYMKQAEEITTKDPEFRFEVNIHVTGAMNAGKVKVGDVDCDPTEQLSASGLEASTGSKDKVETSSNEDIIEAVDDDKKKAPSDTSQEDNQGPEYPYGGVPLELAELMPTRGSEISQNTPTFLVFGFFVWFLFWIIWRWYWYYASGYPGYKESKAKYNQAAAHVWGVVIVAAIALPVGGIAWYLITVVRKFLPTPVPNYEMVVSFYNKTVPDFPTEKMVINERVTMSSSVGRPSVEEMFDGAAASAEPGILLCAPTKLMEHVKTHARKKNNPFFLKTRYCIYEESFEF